MEQEEYTKEEIDWSYIEFVDNQDILDLIEKVLNTILNSYHKFSTFFDMTYFQCCLYSKGQFLVYHVSFTHQIQFNIRSHNDPFSW